MKKGLIMIPSSGRADLIHRNRWSLWLVERSGRDYRILVPEEELQDYKSCRNVISAPNCRTVAQAYQHCLDYAVQNGYKRVLIMDDDCRISKIVGSKGPDIPEEEIPHLFNILFGYCNEFFPITGVAPRKWGFLLAGGINFNNRMVGLMCLYTPICKEFRFEWGQQSMFDLNYILSVIHAGYNTLRLSCYVQDDTREYLASGGCASYRTVEGINESAIALYKKYPKCVNVVERLYRGTRGLAVKIDWKYIQPGVFNNGVPGYIRNSLYKYSSLIGQKVDNADYRKVWQQLSQRIRTDIQDYIRLQQRRAKNAQQLPTHNPEV